ncbi:MULTISPECIES: hypothetical protein [Vibrio]|mgnify:CR=1 FL=1|uniref:Uncharacterized protein n=1 Tax=Vibrio proteolyticus NBRC 13287 TaxID=1219065 RepID=U3BGJ5_VIBPR|nr:MULTISPECIES: hypothetical protein [Vibrio]NAW57962.1 hypothetical protein [Vibrio sp. V36_P2S2PM302]NAX21778.1 hypothetical protein [Vibrio sp. V39_P1S14PM300]NAX25477.1 hypothetical protein [Vibrio sp. V38_P2S17PM301]NAX28584.1 hypothetical protein [Vibrio sp. V37_P2S8PM304]GAD68799.1 hypothetical protein VPR01S_19_00810 [Vibrio proteolyticus NBRC 13287]
MIAKHRNYLLMGTEYFHARMQVNPVGVLDVDIVENQQHYRSNFDDLKFEKQGKHVRVIGREEVRGARPWQLTLAEKDADDLHQIIEQASEELEILHRDLM